MGKRANSQANQRVAASRVLAVSCERVGFAAAVQELTDKWNTAVDEASVAALATKGRFQRWLAGDGISITRHYFLLERSGHLWVTFGVRAARVAERGFNPNDRGWLAVITPGDRDPDGTLRITVRLDKWSVNDRHLIWNGDRYVQLLDGLVAGLSGRYISDPVDESDHRFVSIA
jgi:hypothetical protein